MQWPSCWVREAQQPLQQAIEAELSGFLEQFQDRRMDNGRAAMVRNGHLPERDLLTKIGPVSVKVPKVSLDSTSQKPLLTIAPLQTLGNRCRNASDENDNLPKSATGSIEKFTTKTTPLKPLCGAYDVNALQRVSTKPHHIFRAPQTAQIASYFCWKPSSHDLPCGS